MKKSIDEILKPLVGLPLMTSGGAIYFLYSYEIKIVEVNENYGFLGFKSRKVEYERLNSFTFSESRVLSKFVINNMTQSIDQLKELIRSRNRYITLLKSLNKVGYTIKKR